MFQRRKKSTADLVKERVQEITETLTDKAADLSSKAAVAIVPTVGTAREAASSAYEQASTRVREDIAPKVREEYVAKVRDAAAAGAAAALVRAGVQPPEKKHRLRKLLVLLGLGGAAAYAAKRFGLIGQSDTSFGTTSPSGSSYAGPASSGEESAEAGQDAGDEPGAEWGDEAGEASADESAGESAEDVGESGQDDGGDATDDVSTEFTTTPPTVTEPSAESGPDSEEESKPTA